MIGIAKILDIEVEFLDPGDQTSGVTFHWIANSQNKDITKEYMHTLIELVLEELEKIYGFNAEEVQELDKQNVPEDTLQYTKY